MTPAYRGITVTAVLSKLFAMVLEARMSAWADLSNLRADGLELAPVRTIAQLTMFSSQA